MTYQMDYANKDEAIREVDLDLREGADLVMVKPDSKFGYNINIKDNFKIPVLAYHVSGEYLMIKAALKNIFNEEHIVLETLTSIEELARHQ